MKHVLPGVAILLAACVSSSGPKPLKPSLEETFPAEQAVVYQAALKAVTDKGLPLREAAPDTRVIQTDYVDIASFDPLGASQYPASERLVRFRILIAPSQEGPGSAVAIFGIYAPFRTGYSTSERNERAIPRDHPAMGMVRDIRETIAKATGR